MKKRYSTFNDWLLMKIGRNYNFWSIPTIFKTSKIAQNYFVNNIREYPLIEGVKTHPLITSMGDIKQPDISLSDLSDIEGSAKLLQEAGALPE